MEADGAEGVQHQDKVRGAGGCQDRSVQEPWVGLVAAFCALGHHTTPQSEWVEIVLTVPD